MWAECSSDSVLCSDVGMLQQGLVLKHGVAVCSGKSCYIRQAALIAIMAQVCSLHLILCST